MKKISFLLLISFSCFLSKAEDFNFYAANNFILKNNTNELKVSEIYYKKEKDLLVAETKKAKRLKIAGLFFTSLGTAGIITTVPFMAVYGTVFGGRTYGGAIASTVVGVIGITPSVACLAAGIPMTVVGFKKAKKIHEKTPKDF